MSEVDLWWGRFMVVITPLGFFFILSQTYLIFLIEMYIYTDKHNKYLGTIEYYVYLYIRNMFHDNK